MRPPRRPLKQIARPLVSLTQMNETPAQKKEATKADEGASVEALKQEYLAKGAMRLPLVLTKRDLRSLRHHVMRLQSKGRVNIEDEEQFTPPIRLHRRDPRAPPSGAGSHFEEEETKEDVEEAKERERLEMQKEERRKIREENMAKIAPSGAKKPAVPFQKKTEQKYRPDDTPEARKRQLLRYEETLPWHLEDFENKQTWVGTYESELSEAHVMLTPDFSNGQGAIQMAPMERWYRFQVKSKVKGTNAEDVDKALAKTEKVPSFLSNLEKRNMKREQEYEAEQRRGMRTRVGGKGDDDEGRIRPRRPDDDEIVIKREADADDIDFNVEEDFADDEEGLNGLFEGEDVEVKDAAERLKRDQLAANAFELRSEEQIYRQEEREKAAAEEAKIFEKQLRKALARREKNYDYLDDDENKYGDTSEDETDSETERQRAKEEEEKKAAEQNGNDPEGAKVGSGASTKGSNTPLAIHKAVDMNKKKRPGSPNLSDASGNESSRKKHKKKHDKLKSSALKGAASGSESEMTDAGKSKKHKLKVRLGGASPGGSPGGSRAGSPAATQANGSRAGSPAAPGSAIHKLETRLPSAQEIYDALPAGGMTIQSLITTFKDRVDKSNTQLFIRLVKAVSSFDKQRSWLTPLAEMPAAETINAVMNNQK
ncbi:Rap30/74 interaction domain-containing protein, partial [Corynespora cassiicola Philippines]